jgi:hypothetical protein
MKPEGGTVMAVAELQNRRQQRILTLLHAPATSTYFSTMLVVANDG